MPTESFNKAITGLTTQKVILTLITLSHPDWAVPIRMVDNTTPIISNGETFTPYSFTFTAPGTSFEDSDSNQLVVDDIDRVLNALFSSVNSEVDMEVGVIMADNPDLYEIGPYVLTCPKTKVAGSQITISTKRSSVLKNKLTGYNMEFKYFPGLFL